PMPRPILLNFCFKRPVPKPKDCRETPSEQPHPPKDPFVQIYPTFSVLGYAVPIAPEIERQTPEVFGIYGEIKHGPPLPLQTGPRRPIHSAECLHEAGMSLALQQFPFN